jgi:hypothetical protein
VSFPGEGQKQGRGGQACMACERFGIRPAAPAVDPTGQSPDEADRLCRTHRVRVMRGYCFLCGVGKVWVSPFSDRSIGCCRDCLIKQHGINKARWIERGVGEAEGEGEKGDWTRN